MKDLDKKEKELTGQFAIEKAKALAAEKEAQRQLKLREQSLLKMGQLQAQFRLIQELRGGKKKK